MDSLLRELSLIINSSIVNYETYYKGKLIESGKYKIGELIYQKCWDRNKKEIKCL